MRLEGYISVINDNRWVEENWLRGNDCNALKPGLYADSPVATPPVILNVKYISALI